MFFAAVKPDQAQPESLEDELPVGTRLFLDQFTITSFLSAGGFGITYVARDSLDREVVIKECFPATLCRRHGQQVGVRSRNRAEDFRSVVGLFHQEAINLARLNHPNIVRVHQVFHDNHTAYLAMDYIRGPDLLQTIEGKVPRLSPARIEHLLQRLLDALAHVHDHGLLHRDIAPDNILLDEGSGEPVLIDFGAARKDETRKSRALSGLRVVKDGYSPQEFYISGSKQAPCSDLYALAATFSHLVTGLPPKTSRERLASIANRQGDPQLPLVGRVRGFSGRFLAAIDKAMSIFPRDRPQSVAEWQAMIADTAAVAPEAITHKEATPAVTPPLHRDRLVRAAAFTLLLAGLVSMAGELYDRFWSPRNSSHLQGELTAPRPTGLADWSADLPVPLRDGLANRFGKTSVSPGISRAWLDNDRRADHIDAPDPAADDGQGLSTELLPTGAGPAEVSLPQSAANRPEFNRLIFWPPTGSFENVANSARVMLPAAAATSSRSGADTTVAGNFSGLYHSERLI